MGNCCTEQRINSEKDKEFSSKTNFMVAKDNIDSNQFPDENTAILSPESESKLNKAQQLLIEKTGLDKSEFNPIEELAFGGPYLYTENSENPGAVYMGNFKNGFKHGFGVILYSNDACYMGYWNMDQFDKKGAIQDYNNENNSVYTYYGQWLNGIFHFF